MEGDVVVRINDKPTIHMTHEDAHHELIAAGTEFVLGVLRLFGLFFIVREFQDHWLLLRATSLLPQGDLVDEAPAVTIVAPNDVDVLERIDKIIPDASVTDEAIAELLSGEAEVLKGHGVLG